MVDRFSIKCKLCQDRFVDAIKDGMDANQELIYGEPGIWEAPTAY